jgi:hypothetical protein
LVKDHRWERLTAAVAARPSTEKEGSSLCAACRDVLSATGAGITLVAEGHRSQLCASDEVTATLEELQFTLGQGPSVDACSGDRPVLVAELATDRSGALWPAFVDPAVEAGVVAMFAFPLRVGAARLGSLTLYQDRAGPLTIDAHADGLTAAAHVTEAILAMQANAAPDVLAQGLSDAGASRAEVHQASGMISVQLGIGIVEAMVRLRSHAYVTNRPIGEVATDVVARRLRLRP